MKRDIFQKLEAASTTLIIEKPQPYLLTDQESVLILAEGKADIYYAFVQAGELAGRRKFLFTVAVGQVIFASPADHRDITWMVSAAPGSKFLRIKKSRLREIMKEKPQSKAEISLLIEQWVDVLLDVLWERTEGKVPPKNAENLLAGEKVIVSKGASVRAQEDIIWLKQPAAGGLFLSQQEHRVRGGYFFPLNKHAWLTFSTETELETRNTQAYLEEDADWQGLEHFHLLVQDCLEQQQAVEENIERQHLELKKVSDQTFIQKALTQLANIIEVKQDKKQQLLLETQDDSLLACCRLVGTEVNIKFVAPSFSPKETSTQDPLGDIVRASHVRMREVLLKGKWWQDENGPLLAYKGDDKRPVALIPVSSKAYELHDPVKKERIPVTSEVAQSLEPFAYTFYRPFPNHALKLKDILKFGFAAVAKKDILAIVYWGIAGGLLGIVTPVAIGILFGSIIPEAQRDQLFYMTLILVGAAVAMFLFQITQSIAMLRVETKLNSTIQASVWDRLLNLPVPFFRNYTAGDLAHRANSINAISRMLCGATVGSILGGIFSVFSLMLLFIYDVQLALFALLMVIFALLVTVGFGYYQVRYQRKLMHIEGKTAGLILQLIGGIAKLRTGGAENRAFYLWSNLFKEQRQVTYRARMNEIFLTLFNTAFPILTSAVLFVVMVAFVGHRLSPGNFIAFNAAFSTFLGAMLSLSAVIITVLNLVPLYERTKPIFETLPEIDEAKVDPGELDGEIEITRLHFRYLPDGPLILNDVSLQIKPGEFIALVGPSGCGKSTLLRCLLGFEKIESGVIYYDGKELEAIDVRALRRQLGVVLQSGKLMAGDIFTNICGSASANTLKTAWEAAKSAGVDEDIKQMPMGMHTVINEGASTISGGQKQRLLIARAIVNKPRLLFFDEATSALDNRTQDIVSKSLEKLQATRIVIAHRLSTVRNADRIYVLDKGKIVQAGSYKELIEQEGLFNELVKRQIA